MEKPKKTVTEEGLNIERIKEKIEAILQVTKESIDRILTTNQLEQRNRNAIFTPEGAKWFIQKSGDNSVIISRKGAEKELRYLIECDEIKRFNSKTQEMDPQNIVIIRKRLHRALK